MNTLLQDIRYALRMLAKAPGFTAIVILTLALGIGANTAIFSVVNASLLRPLPFPDSERLVDVWGHSVIFDFPRLGMSLPNIDDIRKQSTVFSAVAPYSYDTMTETGRGAPHEIDSGEASAELFPTLGMKPLYGRIFTKAEMQPGQDREVILSFSMWQKQFGSDPRAIGQKITLNDKPYTVIGVMPPAQNLDFVAGQELWVPFASSKEELADRGSKGTDAIARLKPGRTVKQAQAELDAIATRLAKAYPDTDKNWSFRVVSLGTDLFGDARMPLVILFVAVGFVLLIACANVGNLFLSRGWARRRELAIRSTLGATRGRVVRQLLVESLLMALIGGACGLILAFWGVDALKTILPPDTPRVKDLSIDQAVLWFTLGASILAGILFGLAPALLASRLDLNAAMKEGGAGAQVGGASSRHNLLRRLLVVGEIAIAMMLVIGATLALRSFVRLRSVNLGFRPERVLTMSIGVPPRKFPKPEQVAAYMRQILSLTRGISSVEEAGASMYPPLSGIKGESTVHTESTPQNAPSPSAEANRASPGYFRTLGIPLIAGRDFTDADTSGAPDVFVVNQAFAQKFFGHTSPIGKRIWTKVDAKYKPRWGQIVGEIGNTRDIETKEAPEPELFAAYEQVKGAGGAIWLVVRTKAAPLAVVSAIQERIWSLDKTQPIENIKSMDQMIASSNAAPRFQTVLLGIFGALGLVLAVVGIYGVISYSVSQRTHEIGIRMALGAEPQQVMRLVIAQGLKLALAGVAIGIAASLALTKLMASLLFGVSATDPVTFAGVAMVLTIAALAACYIPARRAMRVDPMVALRYE
ncbi:MAG TPA: ABC transporter permease [Candidatus Acidoferrales bacterium]|nr:ABC transporter permease [Candidatus Acidoferrales bacterium]